MQLRTDHIYYCRQLESQGTPVGMKQNTTVWENNAWRYLLVDRE